MKGFVAGLLAGALMAATTVAGPAGARPAPLLVAVAQGTTAAPASVGPRPGVTAAADPAEAYDAWPAVPGRSGVPARDPRESTVNLALATGRSLLEVLVAGRQQARPAPTGGAAVATGAVRFALAQLGAPYVWGATGPDTFDCSGLMMAAYRSVGVRLPRTSREQFWAGTPVPRSALQAGDLVFYATDPADPLTIHHVGMVVAPGYLVHAPHTGDVVRVSPIWDDGYAGAIRIVGGAVPAGGIDALALLARGAQSSGRPLSPSPSASASPFPSPSAAPRPSASAGSSPAASPGPTTATSPAPSSSAMSPSPSPAVSPSPSASPSPSPSPVTSPSPSASPSEPVSPSAVLDPDAASATMGVVAPGQALSP